MLLYTIEGGGYHRLVMNLWVQDIVDHMGNMIM